MRAGTTVGKETCESDLICFYSQEEEFLALGGIDGNGHRSVVCFYPTQVNNSRLRTAIKISLGAQLDRLVGINLPGNSQSVI